MKTRAKFRLNSYTTELQQQPGRKADGTPDYQNTTPAEKRTLNFTPVYSADPESENAQFWAATPSGSIQLGVVNQACWEMFQIGGEYFVEFTPANPKA